MEWISVKDKLPEDDDVNILAVDSGVQYHIATYTGGKWWGEDHGGCFRIGGVTHWMPLPKAPMLEDC